MVSPESSWSKADIAQSGSLCLFSCLPILLLLISGVELPLYTCLKHRVEAGNVEKIKNKIDLGEDPWSIAASRTPFAVAFATY